MKYLKLFEEFNLLLEGYVSSKNIINIKTEDGLFVDSELESDIDGMKMFFNIKLSKGYIMVDFYRKNKDGSKDYSELPISDRSKMMSRISKILSSAYDGSILTLISTHKKYKIWGKEESFVGISFYPKRSETDDTRLLTDNKEAQRTKLYVRFLKEILGNNLEVINDGDVVRIKFKQNIIIGSDDFDQSIMELPKIDDIIENYNIGKFIKKKEMS